MRYRKLDENGDYTFGRSGADFLVDSPEAVNQAISTRLRLWKGEWSLDVTKGTPYPDRVLGFNTAAVYDQAIKERLLGTQGVLQIAEYASTADTTQRHLSVAATVDSIYGTATLNEDLT